MNKLQQRIHDSVLAASTTIRNSLLFDKPVNPKQHNKDLLADLDTTEKFKVYIDPNNGESSRG